jgi:hypothetical protein
VVGCCRWAHRTVRCAIGQCPVCQPCHPTVRVLTVSTIGALSSCCTGQSGAVPDRYCLLSGAPSSGCSDSARTVRALCVVRQPLESTVALANHCFTGAPDSPVNYSGAASEKPEAEEFEVVRPWAPDTVRCARPGFTSVSFAPFFLNPNLFFLLVCVEPLAPVECII